MTAAATTTYTYDHHLIASVRRQGGGTTETVSYTYDRAGNLTGLTDPNGTTTYRFDAGNRMTELTDGKGQTLTFGHDGADRRIRTTIPGAGTIEAGFDNSGRQSSILVKNAGGTQLLKHEYSYTKPDGQDSDQLQSKKINGLGVNYTYDSLQRVIGAPRPPYAYDNANNLTKEPNTEADFYRYNDASQLISKGATKFTFDAVGNTTGTTAPDGAYKYSGTNQLLTLHATAGTVDSVLYDTISQTQPREIVETVGGVRLTSVLTQTSLGVTSVVENGARSAYFRDPRGILISKVDPSGKRFAFVTDQQGSVLGLLGSNGTLADTYSYGVYGETTANGPAAKENPFRYLGAYQLDTGHHLLGYRHYNTDWKRFTQPDPSGQETNAYVYASGDPVNNTDPSGGASINVTGKACLWVCIGVGWAQDDNNQGGLNLSVGVGSPGISGGVKASSGSADRGPSASAECSAGFASLGGGTGGVEGTIGPSYASPPQCSGEVQYQF